jgi:hypothetical protein
VRFYISAVASVSLAHHITSWTGFNNSAEETKMIASDFTGFRKIRSKLVLDVKAT